MTRLRNHESFLKALNDKFPNRDYVILGDYVFNKTPILIEGQYGKCLISPNALMTGRGPSIKNAIDPLDYSIRRFRHVHGNKYDYSKLQYNGCTGFIIVTCPEHGDFKIKNHLHYTGHGCQICGELKCRAAHRSTTAKFIESARLKFGNRYDYSLVDYKIAHQPVKITCRIHGVFEQLPNSHLNGHGCTKCNKDCNGFGRTDFLNTSKGRECTLYLILCTSKETNENFYKIGITSRSLAERFETDMPYSYSLEACYKSLDAKFIWDLELYLKRALSWYRYKPLIKFAGNTECFNIHSLEKALEILEDETMEEISEEEYYKTLEANG